MVDDAGASDLMGSELPLTLAFSHLPSGGRGNHQAGVHAALLGLSSEARVQ